MEIVKDISAVVATCSELAAVVVIVIGAVQAIWSAVATLAQVGRVCATSSRIPRLRGMAGPGT